MGKIEKDIRRMYLDFKEYLEITMKDTTVSDEKRAGAIHSYQTILMRLETIIIENRL